jgi:hypothetical protein
MAPLKNHDVLRGGGNSPAVIVIGFEGGFVRSDDQKHPEVQFAKYLRERCRSDIYAEVFGNHHGRKALHEVLRLLDTDGKMKSHFIPCRKGACENHHLWTQLGCCRNGSIRPRVRKEGYSGAAHNSGG